MHANPRPRAAVRLAGLRPLGFNPALRAWHAHKKPRVETREHAARKPAASCRGSLGGPPPAWNQPGPPGLARTQEAPGGNPGACCTQTRGVVPRFAWRASARLESTRPSGPGTLTRSPGWKPGDSGPEDHPAIHAARRHAISQFNPASHGTREGRQPGVPRLPPGAFCGTVARAPRSPGWKPGDSGPEDHPAIHAARRHAIPPAHPMIDRRRAT